MKPRYLKIQAFGPFAQTETIDFTRLGQNPLFLINGTTGSGKSTLLDAMTFALYGDTTGKERDASDMRCQYAAADLPTEVEFSFELGNTHYRIMRKPVQRRPKSRGEGFTEQAAEGFLYATDASGQTRLLVDKKVKELTERVVALIGLDSEQFRQVMVLPQGLFRKLLLAESKDREPILSKLFQTHLYKQLEDSIKAQAAQVRQQKDAQRQQLMGILQTVNCRDKEELAQQSQQLEQAIATFQPEYDQAVQALKHHEQALEAAQALGKRFAQRDELVAQYQQHRQGEPGIAQLRQQSRQAQAAEKAYPFYSALQQVKLALNDSQLKISQDDQALAQAQADLVTANTALRQAETAYQARDGLTQQLHQLEQLRPKITQLDEAAVQFSQLERQAQQELQARDQSKNQLEALLERQQTLEKNITQLNQSLPDQVALTQQRHSLQALMTQYQAWSKLTQKRQQRVADSADKQQLLNDAKAALQQAQHRLNQLEYAWHLGQAAILAKTLQPQQACPVCGSVTHPQPAQWQQDITPVEQADLTQAKEQLSRAQQACSAAEIALIDCQTAITALDEQLAELLALSPQLPSLDNAQLIAQQQQLTQALDHAVSIQQQLNESKQQQQTLVAQVQQAQRAVDAANQAWYQTQSALALAQQNLTSLQQQIPNDYRTPGLLNAQITQLHQQRDQLQQDLNNAQAQQAQQQKTVTMLTQRLASQQAHQNTLASQHEQAQADWQAAVAASEFSDEADLLAARVAERVYQAWLADIHRFEQAEAKYCGGIEQLNLELAQMSMPDLTQLTEQLAHQQQIFNQHKQQWDDLQLSQAKLHSAQQQLQGLEQKNQALDAAYQVIGTLSEVLSGDNQAKISLQRFVLGVLLDDVLATATLRLRAMTKGRYELLRKDARNKGTKASGLDLEVFDSYTGQSRPVATLSGGESFLAALALALALSDVVQAYAGGIKLDTLFIDEGFGSLDPESLELAIDTLKSLQMSGRTIGIISHVQELKEQMALRIDVIASAQGSQIKLVGL